MKWKDYIIRRRINNIEMWMQNRNVTNISTFCEALKKIGVFPPSDEDLNVLFPNKQVEPIENETSSTATGIDQSSAWGVAGIEDDTSLHSNGRSSSKFRSKRT